MVSLPGALRRTRDDTRTPTGRGTAPPAIAGWAPRLLDACGRLAAAEVRFATEPVALDHAQGPWAFGFRLDGAAGWDGDLVARLGTDRAALDREAAAMTLSATHGCRAPAVRGVEALAPDAGEPLWVLISDAVSEVALPELIGFNLHHSDALLRGFAAHHDAIHRLPVTALGAGAPIPTISARDELARIDADRYAGEVAWLDEHVPAPAPLVLAHGGYQPLAVYGPRPAEWPDHGGPGRGLTVTNWCGAVLAEPEFDVAFTLVAFWSAPFFAPNRSERTAIKMIRTTLLNTYKQGYTAERPIDPDRLRFWQAFHALRGLARMTGAYDHDGSPFAPQDRGELPDDLEPELARHVRQLTRVR